MMFSTLTSCEERFLPGEAIALRADGLVAGYGARAILNGISLELAAGDIFALVGHNGAGKSTLLKSIIGIVGLSAGRIEIFGNRVLRPKPAEMLAMGVSMAPQGNRVLPDLTVEEHLRLATITVFDRRRRRQAIDRALSEFPSLGDRRGERAGALSGGQKQMLVIAAALVLSPQILLLDEPTLGLAPSTSEQVLQRIVSSRAERKISVLIAEQRVREVVAIADRVCVMRRGALAFEASAEQVRQSPEALTAAFV